jgi:pimeloyl-ACP methyl ester carboxylesterase
MTSLASLLVLAVLAAPSGPQAEPAEALAGAWHGTLQAGAAALHLELTLRVQADGSLSGTLDSIDQHAQIPIGSATWTADTLRLELPAIGGRFEGQPSADGATISGTWTQSGASLPLVFSRGAGTTAAAAPAPRRPQEPSKPYPYEEEPVIVVSPAGRVTLAGTLTHPRSAARAPAVVLITGSGPQDRDESIAGHKPFLVLSDALTRRGVAVLRLDDRGVGGSGGSTSAATNDDLVADALAGVAFLKRRADIDGAHIGLVGHSEGGLIAPLAAVQSSDVAFLVLLAAPGLPGDDILYLQAEAIGRASGASDAQIQANRRVQEGMLTIIKNAPDLSTARAQLVTWRDGFVAALPEAARSAATQQLNAEIARTSTARFRDLVTTDPRPTLAKIRVPVLALNGTRDLQVPATEDLGAIQAALAASGNTDVKTVAVPGLNHLFQTATTGLPTEYGQIEETMAPAVLQQIGDWILAHSR